MLELPAGIDRVGKRKMVFITDVAKITLATELHFKGIAIHLQVLCSAWKEKLQGDSVFQFGQNKRQSRFTTKPKVAQRTLGP